MQFTFMIRSISILVMSSTLQCMRLSTPTTLTKKETFFSLKKGIKHCICVSVAVEASNGNAYVLILYIFSNSWDSCRKFSLVRAIKTIWKPCLASSMAYSRPIPDVAPVTIAHVPTPYLAGRFALRRRKWRQQKRASRTEPSTSVTAPRTARAVVIDFQPRKASSYRRAASRRRKITLHSV